MMGENWAILHSRPSRSPSASLSRSQGSSTCSAARKDQALSPRSDVRDRTLLDHSPHSWAHSPTSLIVENCDLSDALFESASGLTTTGATAFWNFYEFPASLLFWRSLSQWVGGLGVVVFFVACSARSALAQRSSLRTNPPARLLRLRAGRIQQGAFVADRLLPRHLCTLHARLQARRAWTGFRRSTTA